MVTVPLCTMAAQTAVKKNRTQPGNHVSTSGMHVLSQDIIDPARPELLRIGFIPNQIGFKLSVGACE
jgi:hypothetical protein